MNWFRKSMLYVLLSRIEKANDLEINEIINAVLRRYKVVYPEWDVVFLSLPSTDAKKRGELLDRITRILKEQT